MLVWTGNQASVESEAPELEPSPRTITRLRETAECPRLAEERGVRGSLRHGLLTWEGDSAPMTGRPVRYARCVVAVVGTNVGLGSDAPTLGLPNTGDKLRSSIACAGFVCFIPLFGGVVIP
jgi:hypothetical protein